MTKQQIKQKQKHRKEAGKRRSKPKTRKKQREMSLSRLSSSMLVDKEEKEMCMKISSRSKKLVELATHPASEGPRETIMDGTARSRAYWKSFLLTAQTGGEGCRETGQKANRGKKNKRKKRRHVEDCVASSKTYSFQN